MHESIYPTQTLSDDFSEDEVSDPSSFQYIKINKGHSPFSARIICTFSCSKRIAQCH